jgi:hypothetical protein
MVLGRDLGSTSTHRLTVILPKTSEQFDRLNFRTSSPSVVQVKS